jgi:S-DNA-T family DNA segregation ATPase FtsK/SpoIIIE
VGSFFVFAGLSLMLCLTHYDSLDNSFNVSINGPTENIFGAPGAYLSDFFLQYFGKTSYLLIFLTFVWGIKITFTHSLRGIAPRLVVLPFGMTMSASALYYLFGQQTATSGVIGYGLSSFITSYQKTLTFALPSFLVPSLMATIAIALLIYLVHLSFAEWKLTYRQVRRYGFKIVGIAAVPIAYILRKIYEKPRIEKIRESKQLREPSFSSNAAHVPTNTTFEPKEEGERGQMNAPVPLEIVQLSEEKSAKPLSSASPRTAGRNPLELSESRNVSLPPLSLLKQNQEKNASIKPLSTEEIHQKAILLKSVLEDFSVRGEIAKVHPGPVVTLYEFIPAAGIKSSRIIGLADDIARSMSALSARIAVIPGRNAIGIELPNETRQTVFLHELLSHEQFNHHHATLAIALGKNIGGDPVIADLARMPHLLVAGTTGSGKSVGVNAMILSILYRLPPERCRFIMIDPKMLELSIYDGIPHLLTPVVTEPRKAVFALKWAVREMEDRYRSMSRLGVRNIEGYNIRLLQAQERGEELTRKVQTGFDSETGQPIFETELLDMTPLSYIVIVVDEMADLMLVAGKEIESTVQRLAQMARAAGIHLIMATQRPSVDVITGTIKANFPTRISFQVASRFDSRTILNEQGAEQLLGRGDMLFMEPGGKILRVHGPFVGDDEVENVVRFLKMQGTPDYIDTITAESNDMSIDLFGNTTDGGDELYNQALEIVRREKKASTSFIQRHLKIGYNRAARIIEQMEADGVVSTANHVGKREVLLDAS